ncbi:MAG TPA: hypothetical protein VN883_02440 [Myxococcales bacterium]|nr:hypothetical protein [Myxococcales bacterium]
MARASAVLAACVALAAAPSRAQQESPAPPPAPEAPAPQPAPEAPSRWALEVDLHGAWGFMVQPKVDHTRETSSRNGGPAVGLSALLRTGYFLAPLLDVRFQPLYRSKEIVDLPSSLGGPTLADGSLRTLGVTGGAAFDFWRVRLAAGIGAYQMQVRSTLTGQRTMRTSEWDMGYVFSASGFVWGWDRIRLGIESRLGVIVDGGTTFFSVGMVVAGDAVRW